MKKTTTICDNCQSACISDGGQESYVTLDTSMMQDNIYDDTVHLCDICTHVMMTALMIKRIEDQ